MTQLTAIRARKLASDISNAEDPRALSLDDAALVGEQRLGTRRRAGGWATVRQERSVVRARLVGCLLLPISICSKASDGIACARAIRTVAMSAELDAAKARGIGGEVFRQARPGA